MKVLLANPPWTPGSIRAASRWPHKKEDEYKKRPLSDKIIGMLTKKKFCQTVSYSEFPFYLGYAAAVLEKDGHEVRVIDSLVINQTTEEFVKEVKSFSPDVLIIETSTPSFKNDMDILERVSKVHKCVNVLCGPHVTALPERTIKNRLVDFVLTGEYEISAKNLVSCIEKGGDLKGVKGIVFKKGNSIIKTGPQPIIEDLDALPFPAWHLMPMERYWTPAPGKERTMEVMSSRGCPFKCTYCIYPQLMYRTSRVRFRDPKMVVDEIEKLIKEYGKEGIYFNDDTFTLNKKLVNDICDEIVKRELKFPWACFGRVDTVNPDMLKKMKDAGCVAIQYGIESGSPKILDNIKKGITREQIKKAFRMTSMVGIKTHGTFMIGLPGETKETIRETLDLIKEIDCDTLVFALATPFPGTVMYEQAKMNGWLEELDWEKYDGFNFVIMRTEGMNREQIKNSFDYVRSWWGVYRKTRNKQFMRFIRGRYKEGGAVNLMRSSLAKSVEITRDLNNRRKSRKRI